MVRLFVPTRSPWLCPTCPVHGRFPAVDRGQPVIDTLSAHLLADGRPGAPTQHLPRAAGDVRRIQR